MKTVLVVLLVAILAISLHGGAGAGSPTGSVSGVLFDDLDGNGVRDAGEPGLPGQAIGLDGVAAQFTRTDDDGSFEFPVVDPGEYVLSTNIPDGVGFCVDVIPGFDPLLRSWCLSIELPWDATPEPVPITVEPGSQLTFELAARPADVAFLTGIAVLEDDYAPDGTTVAAFVDGQECGSTTTGGFELNYELFVLGARERDGCAEPGDTVTFEIGGVPAQDTTTFTPFVQRSGFGLFQIENLVASENYAWYWFQGPMGASARQNIQVEAVIDAVCGEATVQELAFGGAFLGFSRLIVPSEEILPGCGRAGASVSFLVDGILSQTKVAWEPGVHQIDLYMAGDADCDLLTNAVDASLVLQLEADLVDDVACTHLADVTGDGLVDSRDAARILQFVAGLIDGLIVLSS